MCLEVRCRVKGSSALYYTPLSFTALHYTVLQYTTAIQYSALQNTILHCCVLHDCLLHCSSPLPHPCPCTVISPLLQALMAAAPHLVPLLASNLDDFDESARAMACLCLGIAFERLRWVPRLCGVSLVYVVCCIVICE
jgi:hypothetical protein